MYVVINELKLKIAETQISKSKIIQTDSELEADSRVYKDQLESYLIFTELGNAEPFLEERVESGDIEINKNLIIINNKTELPKIDINQCERYRCLQFRKEFSEIPSSIWKGLLGTEDFRFLEHRGVDLFAIARAVVVDVIAMKFIQGGSTLTQQLVKNLFLTNEKKISRKLKEMVYALYIENVMDKEEIITLYLNEVFWGSFQGVYLKGFHAASLAYFNKAPKFLNEFEATLLVSLLKGPNYYRPTKAIDRLKNRTTAVFKRLQSLNLVTDSEQIFWSKARWQSFQENFVKRNNNEDFYVYYLVSTNREAHLEPFEKLVLFSSMLKRKAILKDRLNNADIGMKVLIASKECTGFDCAKIFTHYSKVEREKRKAMTEEYHQIGSLFKPIVYDTFIELGRSYDEEISTEKITLNLKSGKWSPKDYSKAKTNSVLLKTALQKSKNIPLIRVASEVGFEKLEEKLLPRIPKLQTPLAEYPAQLLGALELSVEEVFNTYNGFINDKCTQIKDKSLKFEETILYYMSVASETTISRLARNPLKSAYIFGKTGTTNQGLDNWYFAFDGKEVYVFWFGVDSDRNKHDLRISGATTSFMIFQDFINHRGKLISEILCD
ncbi:MAG: penicillin-binding protein 1B [Bacteriovoracaceae bacterium]|jgi:penicillin-binding protein 1B